MTGSNDLGDEPHGSPLWIVESKMTPSRPNIETVQRGRLEGVLDSALPRRLALVTAPAGFGKSTLLQQWCENAARRGVSCAWLTLDENDADARQFLAYVALSLTRSGLNAPDIEVGARNGFSDSPIRAVARSLITHLHADAAPRVLVLDDYHRASSAAVDDVVKSLLHEAPEQFTIVVSSREPATLDAPALIAAGDAIEIGPDQLRLTKEETVSAVGDGAAAARADEIYHQTEGWPVAVQLALVQRKARPSAPVDAFASRGVVASYLTEQVLSALDEPARDFLLSVSVLERFNPSLANAVRGAEDSWRLLAELQPLTALIIPLDSEGDWYRLHHLFADYLRETLLAEDPKRPADIYLRASAWHEQRGFVVEAVKYASLARDYAACARIVLDAGGWQIIIADSIGQLRNLLRPLPDKVIERDPGLLCARAYLHCKDGEVGQARASFDTAVALRAGTGDPAFDPQMMTMKALIDIYDESVSWAEIHSRARKIAPLLDSLDPLEAGTLTCMQLLADLATGELDAAGKELQSAFGYWRQSGAMTGLNYAYLHAGVIALYRAKFDEASANISRALELAEGNFGSDSGLKHVADVLHFSLKSWQGELSHNDVDEFSRTLSYIEDYDSWAENYFVGFDGAFHLALQLNDASIAAELTERLGKVMRQRGLNRLDKFFEALRVQTAHLNGRTQDVLIGCEKLLDWALAVDLEKNPEEWQSLVLALTLPVMAEGGRAERALSAIDRAAAFANSIGARFHALRLSISRIALLRVLGRDVDAREELLSVLKAAARERLAGVFLANEKLRSALRAARDELRGRDEEAITLNFVIEVLKRYDDVRQTRHTSILTPREHEILERLASGETNKHIARVFDLTENTVKFHLKNIFVKLNVSRRGQAIAEARKLKLIE